MRWKYLKKIIPAKVVPVMIADGKVFRWKMETWCR